MTTTLAKTNGNRTWLNPLRTFTDIENLFNNNWLAPIERTTPAVNVSENDKNFMVEVIAPGFKKDDFKVNCDDNTLTISAETSTETKEEDRNYSRREYSCSSFTRSFDLPENAKADNIAASYHDGILNLTIPKKEIKTKPTKTIPIN